MSKEDLIRIADLLAHIYLPAVTQNCTAIGVQEALKDISKLQKDLRDFAENQK